VNRGSLFFPYAVAAESGWLFDRETVAFTDHLLSQLHQLRLKTRATLDEISSEPWARDMIDTEKDRQELEQLMFVTLLTRLAQSESAHPGLRRLLSAWPDDAPAEPRATP
jgi:hypothetical protein